MIFVCVCHDGKYPWICLTQRCSDRIVPDAITGYDGGVVLEYTGLIWPPEQIIAEIAQMSYFVTFGRSFIKLVSVQYTLPFI